MKAMNIVCALALVLLAIPAAAQTYDWSNVGSVGIIPAGSGHTFTGPTFTFSPFRTGTLTARYNVTNTYGGGIDKTPPWTRMRVAYTDNSSSGTVAARLYQVDKCSNQEILICSVLSADGHTCDYCDFGSTTFDFANYIYYIQVNINRSVTTATESLHSLAIE